MSLLLASAWLTLPACHSDAGKADDSDIPVDPWLDPDAPPALALQTPPPASFVDPGATAVAGEAIHAEGVTVSGTTATVAAGRFAADLDLPSGITTLEVAGVDPDGNPLTDSGSVLAGPFAQPDGEVAEALRIRLGAGAFAELGPLLGSLLDPAALSAQVTALNPVLDTAAARIDLEGVSFDAATIALVPADGELLVDISIPNFVLGIDATVYDALPFGIDLSLSPELKADEVHLTTAIGLTLDATGHVDATVAPLQAELVAFDLDTGILELVDWLFVDDDDLADTIEAQLAALGDDLEPALDSALAGIAIDLQTELLGAQLALAGTVTELALDPSGLTLGLGMAIDTDVPTPDVPGHLTFPAPPPPTSDDVALQISDAFLDRALFELWAAHALDLDLPLGAEDAAILFVFGGQGSGNLSLSAGLPPGWLERGGEARMQLGELALTVDTPGGDYGDRVELIAAIDAAAALEVTPDAAGIVLSGADVKMRATGDSARSPELLAALPTLTTAFGLGIGAINDQLSFPLTDLLGPDAVLPTLAFQRDPSGVATLVELSVADLLPLLGLPTTTQTSTTSTTGLSVAIPPGATVSDGDDDVPGDGVVSWVCSRDDLVVQGDGGTWYVDDNGEVRIEGTGHTVYAVDGATVVLESAGNTVYADPGADVRDNDGTNAVTVYDPLTFDLASAPSPGC
ncbi:MAG: hypothetical protein R3F59_00780 [Myxococcota bacterium]